MAVKRQYLTAIGIYKGIITVIEANGTISKYRQRGIDTLSGAELVNEVKIGNLSASWGDIPELPKHYSVYFEDSRIMGKPTVTYRLVLDKKKAAKNV